MTITNKTQTTKIASKTTVGVERPRYNFFDTLKIIAIICVVIYHSIGSLLYIPNNPKLQTNISYFIQCFLSTCVPLFFIINGALLFNRELDIKKHFKKIVKTFFLIYLWSFIVAFLNYLIKDNRLPTTYEIFRATINLKIQYNNHIWYLLQLELIYLIFPFLKLLFDHNKSYFLFFTTLCIFVTFGNSFLNSITMCINKIFGRNVISNTLTHLYDTFIFFFDPTIKRYSYSMAIFMLGGVLFYWLANNKEKILKHKLIINIFSPFIFILFLLLSYIYGKTTLMKDNVFSGYGTIYTLTLTLILFIWSYTNEKSSSSRFKTLISKNIFGIYILHFCVQNIVYKVLSSIINYNIIPMKFIGAIITFFISLLISYLINKNKVLTKTLKL